MAEVTIVSGAPGAHATGQGSQAHLIYATNSGRWWLFYLSSTATLATAYSSDFATWTAGGTKALAHVHSSEGQNLSVAYANISSTDVVHIAISYESSNGSSGHIRATISGTTITFGTEFQLGTALGSGGVDGVAVGIDAGGFVYQGTGFISSINTDFGMTTWANADTSGASWTQGTEKDTHITTVGGSDNSHAVVSLGSNTALALGDNSTVNNILWSKWGGSSWSPTSSNNVLASNVTGNYNQWGVCRLSNTDVHFVYQSSTATFTHRRFNGTSWSNGNTIPTLTFKSQSGVALISDGTNVWMFCIASASGNAVQYIKWNGSAWDAAWSTLESTSATRNNVSVCPQIQSGKVSVIWTEGSSTFNIAGEQLTVSSGTTATQDLSSRFRLAVADNLSTRFRLAAQATQDLSSRFRLAIAKDLTSRFRLSATATQDLATRLRLAVVKDLSSRFRLATAKDLSTRLRLAVGRDLASRFRLSVQVTRDMTARFRLAVGKDVSSRFRLALADDLATRFRVSAQVTKDLASRYRLALARDLSSRFRLAVARDLASRLRLSATATKDLAARYRLALAKDLAARLRVAVAQDLSTRFRLTTSNQATKDLAARFRLSATATRDLASRFRLSAQRTLDLASRFKLSATSTQDIASRFRLAVLVTRDLATRYRLAVGKDLSSRFRLALALNLVSRFKLAALVESDLAARFRLSATSTHDLATRLRLSALVLRDLSSRFRLSAQRSLDLATRFKLTLQGLVDQDISARFRLSVGHDLACRFRLIYFPPLESTLVAVDGLSRLLSNDGALSLVTPDGTSAPRSPDGTSLLMAPDEKSTLFQT